MIYEVDINGRTRRVALERAAAGYAVTIDGHRHAADVTVINGVWSLILGGDGLRHSYEIAILEQPPASGRLSVHVNGRVVSAAVGAARGSWGRRGAESAGAGTGAQRIIAPMPGKVVRVLVAPGDTVVAAQGVAVVEAMKMENELRAPKAGTVAEVKVAEGDSVEAGTVLAVIE